MNEYTIMIMSHENHDLLKTCLDRVRQYSKELSYSIVIVDDASDTPYTADELELNPSDTIVRMPRRSNCCNLRNVGMEMAQTDWVFWLDNDTFVDAGWYEPFLSKMTADVGLIGQKKDARLIRKPFLPLNQSDCMIEYEFAYDYNHTNDECDFITSYCVAVRKAAYRPTYCWTMPTPCLDPELGATVKAMGYRVVVCDNLNVTHIGSMTPRPNGRDYLHHLAENFTKWFLYWEPYAPKIFALYGKEPVVYSFDANEPNRSESRDMHGEFDKD